METWKPIQINRSIDGVWVVWFSGLLISCDTFEEAIECSDELLKGIPLDEVRRNRLNKVIND